MQKSVAQRIACLHLHQGTSYRYAACLPIVVNETGPLVKPPYYGHIFVEKLLGASKTTQVNNIDLNSYYYSAYVAYESGTLSRVAILNLLAWDPLNITGAETSLGTTVERPAAMFNLKSPQGYKSATVELLTAPGGTYHTNITVAGISYDYSLARGRGVKVGKDIVATPQPGKDRSFSVNVEASQVVIVKSHR
jgi:Glycosyl hydrolase family 79 C-terminal beta domain